jgi:hypothetical protein
MKKVTLIILITLFCIELLAPIVRAAELVPSRYYYAPWRDEYRMDYVRWAPGTYKYLRGTFYGSSNQYYEKDWTNATGIMYLTCNGTYKFYYIGFSDEILGEMQEMITTNIANPTCDSYQDDGAQNDLDINYTDQDGSYDLDWSPLPGASSYLIYQDGEIVGNTTDTNYNIPAPGGSVTVVAVNENNNPIGSSDIQVPTFEDEGSWQPPGAGAGGDGCSTCDKLKDLLNCPGWDDYMGEWQDLLTSVIPPPPDWHNVSTIFVDAFDDFFGDMPEPPDYETIVTNTDVPLPELDISTGVEDLVPIVPSVFDNPIDFDLSDAPVIEIVDESPPFLITNPLDSFDTVPFQEVVPGDASNHSHGIEQPTSAQLPADKMPEPSNTVMPPDFPAPGGIEYDHMTVPKPAVTTSPVPKPINAQ